MQEVAERVLQYCQDKKSESDFVSDAKTADACIRNFQILGEAAKKIPQTVQAEFDRVPWKEIKGMRNVLVHEYFGVSSKILWRTIRKDLPAVVEELRKINQRLAEPVHPWRICPPGEVFVHQANVKTYVRSGSRVREHLRREHCRESESSGKDILTPQEAGEMAELFFGEIKSLPSHNDLGFGKRGLAYDRLIGGWVKYWNDVFKPDGPLDPNVVKALIATESSFNPQAGKGKRGGPKGLMQLMPLTQRYLRGERKELKSHIFNFTDTEVFDPNLNISAGVRWLFRKRETASARLGRLATWEEAVSEYKDYLRRVLANPKYKQPGMDRFRVFFEHLRLESEK